MATISTIEWTEMTWNPVTGCSKLSAGCRHCYAARMALRLRAMGNRRYVNGFDVTLHDDLVDLPTSLRQPRVIFVNSMSDLFHEHVPEEFIGRVLDTMAACPQHTFQVLTKRSGRLREIASQLPWPKNLWIGVSVEDSRVLGRIDDLRQRSTGFQTVRPGRMPALPSLRVSRPRTSPPPPIRFTPPISFHTPCV